MSLEEHESSTETSTEPADVVGTTADETPDDADLESGADDEGVGDEGDESEEEDDDDDEDWDEEEDDEEDGAEGEDEDDADDDKDGPRP